MVVSTSFPVAQISTRSVCLSLCPSNFRRSLGRPRPCGGRTRHELSVRLYAPRLRDPTVACFRTGSLSSRRQSKKLIFRGLQEQTAGTRLMATAAAAIARSSLQARATWRRCVANRWPAACWGQLVLPAPLPLEVRDWLRNDEEGAGARGAVVATV